MLSKDPAEAVTPESYVNYDSQSRKYYFLSEELDDKSDVMQRCHDLQQQVLRTLHTPGGSVPCTRASL
ncbi:hypothetical protein FKM82_023585 [Ascaphus truei]